jgi:hypothetical protein
VLVVSTSLPELDAVLTSSSMRPDDFGASGGGAFCAEAVGRSRHQHSHPALRDRA